MKDAAVAKSPASEGSSVLAKSPWLGIRMSHPEPRVILVHEASGSADAGIKLGDLVKSVAGTPVDSPEKVVEKLSTLTADQTIDIVLVRDGAEQTVKVFLGKTRP